MGLEEEEAEAEGEGLEVGVGVELQVVWEDSSRGACQSYAPLEMVRTQKYLNIVFCVLAGSFTLIRD